MNHLLSVSLRNVIGITLLIGVGCQTTSAPSTPIHMLRLFCEGADNSAYQSRIAVLDIGDPIFDFGFATGHGVPPQRPCAVKDFEGGEQPVNLIRFADNYEVGNVTDWAILRFEKMPTQNLVRYELEPIEDMALLESEQFYFAQARGLAGNAQSCRLSILDFKNGLKRVTHDCRAISGQSGSPITRIVEERHKLVGLHIGHLWMFQSPETNRPDRKGYINLLDQETLDEIEAVIAALRS